VLRLVGDVASLGCWLLYRVSCGDDGAATEEKMCRWGGVWASYTEGQRRRSVIMGNGREMWVRGRQAQEKKAWKG